MLVLQSDFSEWFTQNYDGENTVEIDFCKQVQDKWDACVALAEDLIEWYERLSENHDIIFTTKWWEKLRFHNFGTQLADKLNSQASVKRELRDLFKGQNDKCSYYDLF